MIIVHQPFFFFFLKKEDPPRRINQSITRVENEIHPFIPHIILHVYPPLFSLPSSPSPTSSEAMHTSKQSNKTLSHLLHTLPPFSPRTELPITSHHITFHIGLPYLTRLLKRERGHQYPIPIPITLLLNPGPPALITSESVLFRRLNRMNC